MSTYRAFGPSELACAQWRKSTYSGSIGECIEVAALEDGDRAVRDSKHPTGPVLTFTPAEWTTFCAGVCSGEFD